MLQPGAQLAHMQRILRASQYFVFVNRRKAQMKMLYFTATGYCLWAKRLEQGHFRVPLSASRITRRFGAAKRRKIGRCAADC